MRWLDPSGGGSDFRPRVPPVRLDTHDGRRPWTMFDDLDRWLCATFQTSGLSRPREPWTRILDDVDGALEL